MFITTFRTKLLKKEKASEDTWKFFFEHPSNFSYEAGQYIKLFLNIKKPDSRGKTRYFTLSSSPSEKYLLITTRILKSTFKLKLGDIKLGTSVKMRGPWGDFILSGSSSKPLVFMAGGIGMTPFRSMIKFAAESKLDFKITMLASYKTHDQILFKEELDKISKNNPSIKIITTVTQPENSKWRGEKGRIDEKFIKKHIDNYSKCRYYICGPEAFVSGMEKIVKAMGIAPKNILKEDFSGY